MLREKIQAIDALKIDNLSLTIGCILTVTELIRV